MGVIDDRAHWVAETAVAPDRRAIGTVVTDNAQAAPDRAALLWPNGSSLQRWTWADVRDESVAFALRLLALARPGDVVAIFAANSADWVFFEYGAALAGITFTAVNTALADAEVAHVLEASGGQRGVRRCRPSRLPLARSGARDRSSAAGARSRRVEIADTRNGVPPVSRQ